MSIHISSAAGLSWPELTALFNAGYEGYIVPVSVNEAYVQNHVRQHDTDLSRSAVAFDGELPVGFAFLAIRGQRGWVAGVGVATAYRGKGVGRALMLALFENARAAGLEEVVLEVIVGNEAAHTLYQKVGMVDTGRILIVERTPGPLPAVTWAGDLADGDLETALAHFDALHNRPNVWQRSPQSIRQAGTAPQVRLARVDGVIKAYAIGYFSDERIALLDVGVDPAQPEALTALLTDLHTRYPQAAGRLVNLNDDDRAWPVLESLGYTAPMGQHTMRITL
jgi:GNAT superfamily N-acetyltransferase